MLEVHWAPHPYRKTIFRGEKLEKKGSQKIDNLKFKSMWLIASEEKTNFFQFSSKIMFWEKWSGKYHKT